MIAPIVAGLLWKFLMIDNRPDRHPPSPGRHPAKPQPIGWLSNPDIVLFSVAVPDIWLTTSFMCLVLFAGLQNIPGDLIELPPDGARPRAAVRIILPLLGGHRRGTGGPRDRCRQGFRHHSDPDQRRTPVRLETMSLLIYRTMIRFGDPGRPAMGTIYLLAMPPSRSSR
ncbi:hypothetical protein LJR013_000578 [Pseudarthrobacter oxydans]